MGYPANPPSIEGRPPKKRAHQTARGTPHKKQPPLGTAGPKRHKRWQTLLAHAQKNWRVSKKVK